MNTRAEERWEHAVGIRWLKRFALSEAKTFKGVFDNQNVVCKLSEPETVRFVKEQFEIFDPEPS